MELVHQIIQLGPVLNADLHPDNGKAILRAAGVQPQNKGLGGGQRRRNIQQQVQPVLADRLDGGGIAVIGIGAPGDMDPAVGLLLPLFLRGVGTVRPVDGHAVATGDEAHDVVSGDGGAAFGELHQTVVQTFHDNALLALDGLGLLGSVRRLGVLLGLRHSLCQHLLLLPLLLDKREPDEEYLALLTRQLGLTALLQRQPTQLSGGQQQRAALARILVGKPRILMLDEPFSALDSYLREEVEGEVGSLLASFAGTALLVTHNRDEAYRLCKEMIVLNEGKVLRTGTTKAVFADPQSVAAARLTGCKNILPCTPLDSHTVQLDGWDTSLRLALPVPVGCTAVGIRAHDFTPCTADVPNAIPVKAVSTSENPFDWNLICTPPEGTAQLWWKVGKTSLSAAAPEPPQYLCAAPESIMPLKG